MQHQNSTLSSRNHIINSSVWVFIGQFGGQFLRLASNLIMTRLLVPEMFGVMAIANTVMLGLFLCSYIGVHHNIVQSPRGNEIVFLNTAWTVQVIRGFILWLLALVIGLGLYFANQFGWTPADSAYADQSLPYVIAALSFGPLIGGFESTNIAMATRNMLVKRLTQIEFGSQLIGVIAMIAFALVHRSIWALVVGSMVGSFAKVIAGYIALPGKRNHFAWEKRAASELINFGKWILLTTIMGFFVRNSDKLILGALITSTLLGIYTIAIFIMNAIQDILNSWAGKIVLPILSSTYRDTPETLSKMYYKFSTPFNIGALFLSGFLFNAGYIAIEVLYTSEYAAAGDMIQILSISLIGSRVMMAEQCYLAVGKSKWNVPQNLIQLIVLFSALVPAYNYYGMDGALFVIGFTVLLTLPVTWYLLKRLGVLNWKSELITMPAFFVGYGCAELFIMAYNYIKQLLI